MNVMLGTWAMTAPKDNARKTAIRMEIAWLGSASATSIGKGTIVRNSNVRTTATIMASAGSEANVRAIRDKLASSVKTKHARIAVQDEGGVSTENANVMLNTLAQIVHCVRARTIATATVIANKTTGIRNVFVSQAKKVKIAPL